MVDETRDKVELSEVDSTGGAKEVGAISNSSSDATVELVETKKTKPAVPLTLAAGLVVGLLVISGRERFYFVFVGLGPAVVIGLLTLVMVNISKNTDRRRYAPWIGLAAFALILIFVTVLGSLLKSLTGPS